VVEALKADSISLQITTGYLDVHLYTLFWKLQVIVVSWWAMHRVNFQAIFIGILTHIFILDHLCIA